jgi:hypothetical protein
MNDSFIENETDPIKLAKLQMLRDGIHGFISGGGGSS